MSSSKNRFLAFVVASVAALALVAASAARADKPFGPGSLDGTYHFAVIEIAVTTDPVPATVYCNSYGRITFDGAGMAEILAGSSYGWCTDGGDPVEPQTFLYTVDPDGGVVLTEQGSSHEYTTHCQILDKGARLLCDGTGGIGGTRPDEQVLWMATAGKL